MLPAVAVLALRVVTSLDSLLYFGSAPTALVIVEAIAVLVTGGSLAPLAIQGLRRLPQV